MQKEKYVVSFLKSGFCSLQTKRKKQGWEQKYTFSISECSFFQGLQSNVNLLQPSRHKKQTRLLRKNLLVTRKRITQKKSLWAELLCYFFPRCHLRLAVNLCWTCQLSSLITDRPTCFLRKQHPECHGKQTPLLVLLLPRSCQNQKTSGRARRAREELPSMVPCRVGRECPGLCHLPHGRADAARPGWVWWDVAELQRRPVRLWTITGMWEQRREGPLSQLSATHGGDCQEMEMCQIMFHDFGAHNKLWIGLWARGDESDVSAETDFRPQRTATDYGSKIRHKHLMEKFVL